MTPLPDWSEAYTTWMVPTRINHVDPAPGFVLHVHQCTTKPWFSHWSRPRWTIKKILLLKRHYFKTGLLCQKPGGSHVAEVWLDVASVHWNSRLHIQGLRCEIWRQYNKFTHEQVPVSNMQHIIAQHTIRQRMPWLIEAFSSFKLKVVYMKSDW